MIDLYVKDLGDERYRLCDEGGNELRDKYDLPRTFFEGSLDIFKKWTKNKCRILVWNEGARELSEASEG